MKSLQFEQLCRGASLELGLEDTDALGRGFTVLFDGMPFETAFREGQDGFALLMEAGSVPEQKKAAVYANLLTSQIMTWDVPNQRFGFNPQRGTVVQCIDVKFRPEVDSAWLAGLMRLLAGWAPQLRKLLADEVTAQDAQGTVGGALGDLLENTGEFIHLTGLDVQ